MGTWFGLFPEQDTIRRIRACKHSAWDPVTLGAVAVGCSVWADTTADHSNEYAHECARRTILSCDPAMFCRIAFFNKNEDWLTTVTLSLPDDRVLQPIHAEYDDSDLDSWSESSD